MNKKEIVQIAQLITAAYPNQKFPKEKLEAWADFLGDYDFEYIKRNTKEHILQSEYAPTIADLVRKPPEKEMPLRNVSQRKLNDIEKAEREAEEYLRKMGELE